MLVNKVTVVILTYNDFSYIENAIKSVQIQDYQNIEIIVQDDGSKNFNRDRIEECFHITEGMPREYKIFTNEVNVGTVKNYNNAIKRATGEIIITLAGDDCFYDSKVVTRIVKAFEENDMKICFALRKGMDSKEVYPSKSVIKEFYSLDDNDKLARIFYSNFISGATLYYSRQFLEEMGGFDERFVLIEDYSIVIQALLKGIQIHYLDTITINYNETGVSQTSDKPKKVNLKFVEDLNNINKLLMLPNLHRISSRRMRRYLKLRYYRKFSNCGKFKKLLMSLIYIDVVIDMKKNNVNSDNRFKELMK